MVKQMPAKSEDPVSKESVSKEPVSKEPVSKDPSSEQPGTEEEAVAAVIHRYIEGYINADALILRDVFAADAVMNGYVGDRLVAGSPEPFIQRVASEPALKSKPELTLNYDIEQLNVTGNAASVTLREYRFGDFSFTDFMHLLKRDGVWKIVSKTFTTF